MPKNFSLKLSGDQRSRVFKAMSKTVCLVNFSDELFEVPKSTIEPLNPVHPTNDRTSRIKEVLQSLERSSSSFKNIHKARGSISAFEVFSGSKAPFIWPVRPD